MEGLAAVSCHGARFCVVAHAYLLCRVTCPNASCTRISDICVTCVTFVGCAAMTQSEGPSESVP